MITEDGAFFDEADFNDDVSSVEISPGIFVSFEDFENYQTDMESNYPF